MFKKLKSKTKKVLTKIGTFIETAAEIIDEIEGPDFD